MKQYLVLLGIGLAIMPAFAQTNFTSSTLGMIEARQIGPAVMGGRITSIDGVNNNPRILYIGSAGGGVWKTTNGGASFSSIFDKYCQSIGAVTIDQNRPDTIWVGTGESNMRNTVSYGNGIYKSTNGGADWKKVGLDSSEHIAKVIIHPKSPDNVFVAVPGKLWSDSKDRGVYQTTDGGKTWNKIFYINEYTGCADLVMDPNNPEVMLASMWEFRRKPYSFNSGGKSSGLFKTTDGGKNWKKITNGLPEGDLGRIAMTMAPSAPNNMVAIMEAKKTGLYISADGGDTWKKQSATLNVEARPFYFSTIVIDPKDPKRVYRPAFVFSISDDGGYSFTEANNSGGWVHSDHHALWINPQNTSHMYLGTDGGVYVSLDRGNSWIFLNSIPVSQFYHVSVDNQEPYNVYGGLQDNGSWMAPSQSSGGIENRDWQNLFGGDGFWVQPDLTDPDICYLEYQGGNMFRVNKKSGHSVSIKPYPAIGDEKLRWHWNTALVMSPKNPKTIYTASQYLYKSSNQGQLFTKISPDLTTNDKNKQKQEESGGLSADNTSAENHCIIYSVAESPLDENQIWAGTDDGNLQYTTDGGKTWNNVSANYAKAGIPAGTWVSSIQPSNFDKNVVYATFDNHTYGDMKTYVGKSSDLGRSWTLLTSSDFRGHANKILEDLKNKDLLFLGTEMGLFVTLDGGKKWVLMKNNIPEYLMTRDLTIQEKTNDLVIASHGRGILIVDNISILRELNSTLLDQPVHIFEPKATAITTGNYNLGGFPEGGGYTAGNTPELPEITYYLKDRVNTGEVKVEILDKDGKLVQSIPASKRKGINKVYWNMRSAPPKVPTGGTKLDFGGFTGPIVMPGDYKVQLKIGDKVVLSNLKLVHDPKAKYTPADRELQNLTTIELFKMSENLADLNDQVVAQQTQLKAKMDKVKNEKNKKVLQEYFDEMEKVRSEILATKQTSIFADEERLREQLGEVYGSVAGTEEKPTNSQTDRIKSLKFDIGKTETVAKTNYTKYFTKVNEILKKEKVEPLKPATLGGIDKRS